MICSLHFGGGCLRNGFMANLDVIVFGTKTFKASPLNRPIS